MDDVPGSVYEKVIGVEFIAEAVSDALSGFRNQTRFASSELKEVFEECRSLDILAAAIAYGMRFNYGWLPEAYEDMKRAVEDEVKGQAVNPAPADGGFLND